MIMETPEKPSKQTNAECERYNHWQRHFLSALNKYSNSRYINHGQGKRSVGRFCLKRTHCDVTAGKGGPIVGCIKFNYYTAYFFFFQGRNKSVAQCIKWYTRVRRRHLGKALL